MSKNEQNTLPMERPVQLSPQTDLVASEPTCTEADTGCSTQTRYEDIIYIPMMRKFWVIPEQVAQELEESAVTLFNNGNRVAKSSPEDKVALMEALDLSHLMKFFYSPNPASFLEEMDYENYLELEELHEEAQQKIDDKLTYQKPPAGSKAAQRYPGDYTYAYIRWHTQKELNKLDQKGKEAAEKSGYEIDETGEIFTPEQIRLRDMLLSYAKNNKIITSNEKLNKEMYTVFDEINRLRGLYEYHGKQTQIPEVQTITDFYHKKYQQLSGITQQQIALILELGTIGIATPELALGYHDNVNNLEGEPLVNHGLNRVYFMRKKQSEKGKLIDEIGDLFRDWQFFLGNIGASVPQGPFVEKLLELIKLDNDLQQFIEDAEQACNSFVPRKILVWDPTAYQYKGNNALLSAPMPLREFTKPGAIKKIDVDANTTSKELYQFSIKDLAEKTEGIPNFLKKANEYFSKAKGVISHFKQLNNNDDKLLEIYLKERGSVELKIDSAWFNEDKVFNPDALFAAVEPYKINALQNDNDKKAWGELLKYIIFEEDFLKRIMGFDPSYGAQLVRLLSKYTKDYLPFMEYAAKTSSKGPSFANFSLGGTDIKLVASVYHGKLVSDPFYLPGPTNAINPVFSFPHHTTREPISIDFGHFIFKAIIETWGFAGASLALSTDISLYASQGRFGVMVEGPAEQSENDQLKLTAAKGPTIRASGELFAGVQAGIGGTVECKWCPPKGSRGHFWQNLERALRQLQSDNGVSDNINTKLDPRVESNYRTLARGVIGGAAMIGFGVTGEFGLTISGEKIRIRIAYGGAMYKGAKQIYEFDIDPSAAADIIQLVLQAIRKNDNCPIGWYDLDDVTKEWENNPTSYDGEGRLIISESFYAWMTKLMLVGRGVTSLAFSISVGISKLETLYKSLTADFGLLAAHLANTNRHIEDLETWFSELHPQAIGALLYHLSKDLAGNNSILSPFGLADSKRYSTGELIAYQQKAISNCVEWLIARNGADERDIQAYPNTAQIIFGEAVLRMNEEGTNAGLDRYYRPINGDKSQAWAQDFDNKNYFENIQKIEQTMKRMVTTNNAGNADYDELEKISRIAKQEFNKNFPKLTRHINSYMLSLIDFIKKRQQRFTALNEKGKNNAKTA